MAIGLGAALIGGAVIGAGASVAAGGKQASAAKGATAAQSAATAQAREDLQPFAQGGERALNQLMAFLDPNFRPSAVEGRDFQVATRENLTPEEKASIGIVGALSAGGGSKVQRIRAAAQLGVDQLASITE